MCTTISPPRFSPPPPCSFSSGSRARSSHDLYPSYVPLYVFYIYSFLRRKPKEYLDAARISSRKMENNCASNVAPTRDTTLSEVILTPWKIRRSLDLELGSKSTYFSTSGGTMNGRCLGAEHCADISTEVCCVVSLEEGEFLCEKRGFLSSSGVRSRSIPRPCSMMEHCGWRMHG